MTPSSETRLTPGLMQDVPLTLDLIARRAEALGAAREVVSVGPAGVDRRPWRDVARRAARVAGVLDVLGVGPGERVGTYAWNSHRHVELFLGVPGAGRVVHPVNLRLAPSDVAWLVAHAEDRVLFVDAALTGQLAPLRHRLPVGAYVVMEDGAEIDDAFAADPRYEELLAAADPDAAGRVDLDERDAAWLCYTSGTTGRPKGVLASHRSVVLHALGALGVDSHAITRDDVVLAATPMFHVNAWGLPHTCALAPASLVLPGRDTTPDALGALIERERATVATGVPTVWIQMEEAFDAGRYDLSSLRAVLCGGATAPARLVAKLLDRGVEFLQAWGMTEMSPSGTAWRIRPGADLDGPIRAGWPVAGVELRIVGEDGAELPWDGEAAGELEARAPWAIAAYHEPDDDANTARFHDGWLRSGDTARIEADGMVEIVDRTKDLIKSGGEWISPLELEQALATHPDVAEAAVVGVPDPRWGERPLALVVPAEGRELDPERLAAHLRERVAKWWVPDEFRAIGTIPKTAVGKYDKRALRASLEGAP